MQPIQFDKIVKMKRNKSCNANSNKFISEYCDTTSSIQSKQQI